MLFIFLSKLIEGRNSMFRNLLIRYWHSKNKLVEN